MGEELYNNSSAARAVFHEVDMALGRPLTRLLFEGPDETLRQTANAQPAIMSVSLATMRAMQDHLGAEATPRPALVAGHSLGEYTALAVAGVLDVGETAWLVQERGRLMQEACEKQSGSMAAVIGLDAMVVEQICRETGTVISTVNTPDQLVIAGERRALANALDLANARGAKKAVPLRVAGAFHSPLMEPAQAGLIDAVESLNFKDPSIPIVANCTAKPVTRGEDVKRELIAGICSCVHWSRSVDYMMGTGVNRFIEVGPGRVLSGMVKRINRRADVQAVGDWDSILPAQPQLMPSPALTTVPPNTTLKRPSIAVTRRKARVIAVQVLYEIDGSDHEVASALETRLDESAAPDANAYTRKLVYGVLANRPKIDKIIATHAPNWPIQQMAMVDRNILRVAIYEILMAGETPPKVAINEAVELGKIYGADRSPMFVNGVLGALMQPERTVRHVEHRNGRIGRN